MVIKGIKTQTAAAAINALLSFVLMMALARMLGTSGFADYSVLLNAGTLALVLLEGGYALLVYRETAAVSHAFERWQDRLLPLFTGYAVIVAFVLGLLPVGMILGQGVTAWWAVVACMLLVAWMNVYSGLLRGQGRFVSEAMWQVKGRVASLAAILIGVWAGLSTATGVYLAWGAGLILLLVASPGRLPPAPVFLWATPVRQAAVHLMLGQLMYVALLRLDLLAMATLQSPPAQIAWYAAASRFTEAGVLLFAPVLNTLQLAFRQRAADNAAFARLLWRVLLAGLGFALVLTVGGGLLAVWLMRVVFGHPFLDAAPLLVWQMGALAFMVPAQVLAQAAIARNHEHLVWAAYAGGLLVALLALSWLVPTYGAMGAAWAMLLAHASVLVVAVLAWSRVGSRGTR
jgi:O-antigen/teichoic acid export membrane protein